MSNLTPYYDRNGITIYLGDCLEIMPKLDAGCVDLVFVDWPYFKVKNEPWDRQWNNPDLFLEWIGETLMESKRLLKPNGSFYGCASPHMATKIEMGIAEHFNVLNNIRWYKEAGWHKKTDKEAIRSYLSPWEAIIFAEQWFTDESAAKESDYYLQCKALHKAVYAPIGRYIQQERERAGVTRNDVEVALGYVSSTDHTRGTSLCYRWEEGSRLPTKEAYLKLRDYLNSLNCRTDYLRQDYEDLRQDYEDLRRPFFGNILPLYSDIWSFPTVADYPGKHPTEKPISLMEHIIKASTRPDSIILDFCMGNGTTLIAAKNLGRKAIGIDMVQKYCDNTIKRLQQDALFELGQVEPVTGIFQETYGQTGNQPKPPAKQLEMEIG